MNGLGRLIGMKWATALMAFVLSAPVVAGELRKSDVEKYLREGAYTLDGRFVSATRKSTKKKVRRTVQKPARKPAKTTRPQAAKKKEAAKARGTVKKNSVRKTAKRTVKPSQKKSSRTRLSKHKAPQTRKRAAKASKPKKKYSSTKRHPPVRKSRRGLANVPKKKSSWKNLKAKRKTTRTAREKIYPLPYAKETPNEREMPFVSVPRSRVRANPKMIVMEDPASPTVQDPEGPSQVEIAPDEAAPAPVRADAVVNSYPTEVDVSDVREPDAFDLHSGADPIRGGAGPAPASEPAAQ